MVRTVVLVGMVLLSGCNMPQWAVREDIVAITEVGRAQYCAAQGGEAELRLFSSAAQVQQWQERTGVSLGDAALSPSRYAVLEMGLHHTGGYGIAVSQGGTLSGETLKVYATFFSPGPGAMTTQAVTNPCVLMRLPPAGYQGVEVYDQDGELRASARFGG